MQEGITSVIAEILIPLATAVVTLAAGWFVTTRVADHWDQIKKRREIPCQSGRVTSRTRAMGLILVIILILLLVGAFPTRGYGFGYGSHGIIGTILIIILILWLIGRL